MDLTYNTLLLSSIENYRKRLAYCILLKSTLHRTHGCHAYQKLWIKQNNIKVFISSTVGEKQQIKQNKTTKNKQQQQKQKRVLFPIK